MPGARRTFDSLRLSVHSNLRRLDTGLRGANTRLRAYGTVGALVAGIAGVALGVAQVVGDEDPPASRGTPEVITGAPPAGGPCPDSGAGSADDRAAQWLCASIRGSLSSPDVWSDIPHLQVNEAAQLRIRFKNEGTEQLDDVILRIAVPRGDVAYLNGSGRLYTTRTPEGGVLSDNLPGGGINVGSYASGGAAYVLASIQVGGPDSFPCGTTTTVIEVHLDVADFSRRDDLPLQIERPC